MFGFRMFWMIAAATTLSLLCGACNSTTKEESPSMGTAYAGPATLKLHQEIDSKSATVATVHHGDKLDIVGQRRRWYKVRTAAGAEGWTSDRELLDSGQMQRLRRLARETGDMPSQGVATTFSDLNVHMEPSRQSPSFVQVKEHEKVNVIAHRVTPRTTEAARHELLLPKPKIQKKTGKEKASKIPSPPAPVPPALPGDWLQLSEDPDRPPEDTVSTASAAPVRTDDWTLIRLGNGESGWVLTSALYLEIPDEVAQYAEGHRITSYFSLGKIQDGDQKKDIWLWTTSTSLGEDDDFDSYRVFVWSLRHHRYETAYIQRRERGFFPVLAKTGEFSVCLAADDGSRVLKQYVMMGNLVRSAGQRPCKETAEQEVETAATAGGSQPAEPAAARPGLVARVESKLKRLLGK